MRSIRQQIPLRPRIIRPLITLQCMRIKGTLEEGAMNIKALSAEYEVRKLEGSDVPAIFTLCHGNPMFYQHCPPVLTIESIIADMTALPPNKTEKDKYYIGFFDRGTLLAVMDLIDGYPSPQIVFIGFFMSSHDSQGKGIGTKIITAACNYFKASGYSLVRLGYAKGNPQSERFWLKNGFTKTGKETPCEGYIAVGMERVLSVNKGI